MDFLFLAFGVALVAICAKRGLILTAIKSFKIFLSAGAASLWGGAFADFLGRAFFDKPIRNSVYKKVSGIYADATNGFTAESSLESFPKFLRTEDMSAKLNELEESGEALVNSVTDTVADALSSAICGILGFVLVFAFAFLALSLAYVLIKRYKKLNKSFGRFDSLCGGAVGFVFAWLVLLFAGSVMKFFFGEQPVYTDSSVVKFFGDSSLHEALEMLDFNSFLNGLQEPKL